MTEYNLELGVSQDLSIADLISTLKYMLRREFKVYEIDIRIMGSEPNLVTKPDSVGTRYVMRVLRLLISVPVTVNDPKIFYDVIKQFTDQSDAIILLSRY
jgi:hypothetical protein